MVKKKRRKETGQKDKEADKDGCCVSVSVFIQYRRTVLSHQFSGIAE